MKKSLKYIAVGFGSLLTLLVVIAAFIAMTFNPNDYKPQIIKLIQDKKQRTLAIEGDIKLSFWPKIGANLGKVSLSEHNNPAEFASIDSAKVSLSLFPLLKKQLVVDTVYVDGVKVNIIKHKDGTTNFDDLLSKDDSESETIKFDIHGVNVTNSAVNYLDESINSKYSISKFNLKTGHVALAEPIDVKTDFVVTANQPQISAKANLKGNFLADTKAKHYAAKSLDATVQGDLAGGKNVSIALSGDVDASPEKTELLVDGLKLVASGDFSGAKIALDLSAPNVKVLKDEVSGKKATVKLSQTKGDDTMKVNLELADIKGSPKAIQSSGITGDIAGNQGKRTIAGKFSSPFSANLEGMIFDLTKLAGNLEFKDPALPNGGMKGDFALSLHADVKKELVNSQFNMNVDNTKLAGDVSVAVFKQPHINFNLNSPKLDFNKLMPKSTTSSASKTSNKPADLSALNNLFIDGKVSIDQVLYDKYNLNNLNLIVKADGQKLIIDPLSVKLDDSQIKGSVGINQFAKPLYSFNIDIDHLDVDRYMSTSSSPTKDTSAAYAKPLDLSALKALNADGSLRIGNLKYGKTKASNVRIDLKADGQKLQLNPLAAKVDDSQINANFGITQFSNPHFNFNVNIDKLDADKYITESDQPAAKNSADTPIDLSALKKLNASGTAKIGWLKLANVKTENVNIGLDATGGVATISPFSANLYQGSMSGSLKVDARNTPNIAFKQAMQNVAVGPLLVDAINNDMLDGKGTVKLDVTTSGNSVGALKKALAGTAALNLADGAVKGIDIAGTIRDLKSRFSIAKSDSVSADKKKRTDFSEMIATFTIKSGIAHNDDLSMKAPIFRISGAGDIDIGNEKINYIAKPTIVKSLKGQGGADLDSLSGITIPVKLTGSFSSPQYALDYAGLSTAIAKSKLLDSVAGGKADAVKGLLNGSPKDALSGLLNKKDKASDAASPGTSDTITPTRPAEKPKSAEDKAKQKLKNLLKF
ncbi:MAG: AsmA family protein [Methylophilaceae bacterium]|nr:AsmA family protein [Methylophilaceae bacterium]